MKGLEISSLALGIAGILTCWIFVGIIPSVFAVILGVIACINRDWTGAASAGLASGIIGTIASVSVMFFFPHPESIMEGPGGIGKGIGAGIERKWEYRLPAPRRRRVAKDVSKRIKEPRKGPKAPNVIVKKYARMGETVTLDGRRDFVLTLLSWEESNTTLEGPYRDFYYTFTSKPGMKFVALFYKARNNWIKEQAGYYPGSGKVVTDKGYTYGLWSPPAAIASVEYNPRRSTEKEIKESRCYTGSAGWKLLPKESIQDCVIFEIPRDQTPKQARLAGIKPLIKF